MGPRIVFTDAHTMNSGDIDWSPIDQLGEVIRYPYTDSDSLLDRVVDAEIIVTNKTKISRSIINDCPDLKLICVSATGYNNIDMEAAADRNIVVCNAADYSSTSVAQHVFASVLSVYNKIAYYSKSVHEGRWTSSRDFTYYDEPIEELHGKLLGIVGYGNIGRTVANTAKGFGMKIAVLKHPNRTYKVESDVLLLDQEVFLSQSDIVSLHVPLNSSTEGLVNSIFLSKMKSSAILVNTSRGPVVNEGDLAACLQNSGIRAACIDVLREEPPKSSKLFGLENCIITPHQAWASKQARQRLMKIVEHNIIAYTTGAIQNQVF